MAINLQKGERISLKKSNGTTLTNFCVGANWGAIDKIGFFGGKKKVAVDLDLSVGLFDANHQLVNTIFFGKLETSGVKHSGDDLVGDIYGNDGLDNEVIKIDLTYIKPNIAQVVFVLNSYKGQDFATIPFASIRLYEGSPNYVSSVFATYNIASDSRFSGYVSMVLGKLYRDNNEWKFSAIGEPTKDKKLIDILKTVQRKYLK
jgi:tellurium resistance protein TerZ